MTPPRRLRVAVTPQPPTVHLPAPTPAYVDAARQELLALLGARQAALRRAAHDTRLHQWAHPGPGVEQGLLCWQIRPALDGGSLWTVWLDPAATRVLSGGKEATRPRAQGKVLTVVVEYLTHNHKPIRR